MSAAKTRTIASESISFGTRTQAQEVCSHEVCIGLRRERKNILKDVMFNKYLGSNNCKHSYLIWNYKVV